MSTEAELLSVAKQLQELESQFRRSSAFGLILDVEGEAQFKRLATEAKLILEESLGPLNDFSRNLFVEVNRASSRVSLASVKSARGQVEGGVNHLRRTPTSQVTAVSSGKPSYVNSTRLAELRAGRSAQWDLQRLVRLLEELNSAHLSGCHMSVAMIVRAVTDHVPPLLGCRNFAEVANNYAGGKSFRGSMQHLQGSLRNIADGHLHIQIRQSEVLPTEQQVDFRSDLDALLGEIVRTLK